MESRLNSWLTQPESLSPPQWLPTGLHGHKLIFRDEVQGARSAATGMHFGCMRIVSTAQRRNSPDKSVYGRANKKKG